MAVGSVEFYSVTAQVVPVLVLVVLLEQRAHRRLIGPLYDLLVVLSAVLAASLAEIVALHDVYRNSGAATDQYWVILPIAYLAVVIVVPVVVTTLRAVESGSGRFGKAVAWTALLLVGWALAVVALAVTRY
jgi:hypothetical protein